MRVHYILPIQRTGYQTVSTMISQGLLRADPEGRLQRGQLRGRLYVPAQPVQLEPLSDWAIKAGPFHLPTDIYRLPGVEYSALVQSAAEFEQPPHLVDILKSLSHHPGDYTWATGGKTNALPCEHSFSATWNPWRWACLDRCGEWFIVLWFDLKFISTTTRYISTEVALDLGADPLVCAVEPGGAVWSVPPVHVAIPPEISDTLARQPGLSERLHYELQRAELLRFTFFIVHHASVVYAEDLTYRDMDRNFVRWARRSGLLDWHESWLHNRLRAAGIPLEKVDSRGTSCRCSSCQWPHGHRDRSEFRCPSCGTSLDAHENAALNVLYRGQVKAAAWQAAHRRTRLGRCQ